MSARIDFVRGDYPKRRIYQELWDNRDNVNWPERRIFIAREERSLRDRCKIIAGQNVQARSSEELFEKTTPRVELSSSVVQQYVLAVCRTPSWRPANNVVRIISNSMSIFSCRSRGKSLVRVTRMEDSKRPRESPRRRSRLRCPR